MRKHMRTASLFQNPSGRVQRLPAGGWISRIRWHAALAMVAAAILLLPIVMASGRAQEPETAAPTYTVLHSFAFTDGRWPVGGLIRDTAGNLYGTTLFGGASLGGVVFELTPSGTETVLHSFEWRPGGTNGSDPEAALILDSAGNLYGTTTYGGLSGCGGLVGSGCGVVFKLTLAGMETVLHRFAASTAEGVNPLAGVIRDSAGNLYGTTYEGGNLSGCGGSGCGVVFKLTPSGTETVLHSFAGPPADGAWPRAGLIRDSAGNLYGTTSVGGGSSACVGFVGGCGVVFELTPSGTLTLLHSFAGGATDGANPTAGLIQDTEGNFYGTTEYGGASNLGTVFKLTPSGVETVLHSFAGGSADGADPVAGLIADTAGNLYGTTLHGGDLSVCGGSNLGCGVVFKLHP